MDTGQLSLSPIEGYFQSFFLLIDYLVFSKLKEGCAQCMSIARNFQFVGDKLGNLLSVPSIYPLIETSVLYTFPVLLHEVQLRLCQAMFYFRKSS
jgi:hypothetical protein